MAKSSSKWDLKADLVSAARLLGLTRSSLQLIELLFRLTPIDEIPATPGSMIVAHSNKMLCAALGGCSESSVRRMINNLVAVGLVDRISSSNGKRFARCHRNGRVAIAFGIDLSPMARRREEIRRLAQECETASLEIRCLKDRVLAELRALRAVSSGAAREAVLASGLALACPEAATIRFRRKDDCPGHLRSAIAHLEGVRKSLLPSLPEAGHRDLAQDLTGSVVQDDAHNNKNPCQEMDRAPEPKPHHGNDATSVESAEDTGASRTDRDRASRKTTSPRPGAGAGGQGARAMKGSERSGRHTAPQARSRGKAGSQVSLDMLAEACPSLLAFGLDVRRGDLARMGGEMGLMLGIGHDRLHLAREAMGSIRLSVTLAAMIETADRIENPAGYLDALTRSYGSGRYDPMRWIRDLARAVAPTAAPPGGADEARAVA